MDLLDILKNRTTAHTLLTDLGLLIKKERKQKKLTQQQLAKKTGLSKDTISKIENGNENYTIKSLIEILKSIDKLSLLVDLIHRFNEEQTNNTIATQLKKGNIR